MDSLFALATAFWLGVLTSVSPCPLATNLAAMSYIGRNLGNPRRLLAAGLLYTLGRTVAYVIIAALLVWGLLAIPKVAPFLQRYVNLAIGPILILVGMLLLDLISLPGSSGAMTERMAKLTEKKGLVGALILGGSFALAFCPVSAALYFGSLIPLAVEQQSAIAIPGGYGVGTAIPVVVFAFLLGFGSRAVGKAFQSITRIEFWARRVTGALFILVGLYLTLLFVFRLSIF